MSIIVYNINILEKRTIIFDKWLTNLDINIRSIINNYIVRVLNGNTSNCKSLRNGIREIRINYKKGYRVYYTILNGNCLLLLLVGGDKKSQEKDIVKAIKIKEIFECKER